MTKEEKALAYFEWRLSPEGLAAQAEYDRMSAELHRSLARARELPQERLNAPFTI